MLKSLVIGAAMLLPAAAHAQEQQWYLTGASGDGTALMFVERSSVKLTGAQAIATTLLVQVDEDQAQPPAMMATVRFACGQASFTILSGQNLDIDGKPNGAAVPGDSKAIAIPPGSFFEDAEKFACGGSAKPDPALLVGNQPPVRAGIDYLRDHSGDKD